MHILISVKYTYILKRKDEHIAISLSLDLDNAMLDMSMSEQGNRVHV